MNKKDVIVAILATFCLTATLFLMIPTRSETPVGTYDPWVDVTEDGRINILDTITMGNHFLTSGDSTKNVSVMNWPHSTQETAFWQQTVSTYSPLYNASGFGHVHMLWDVTGLTGSENVTISGYSEIHDPVGGSYYTTHFLIMAVTIDNIEGSTNFPVPGEFFGFRVAFASGTTASVNLAYYLTYA